jgi:DNA (cytosine-5)-methyltransferase 1
MHRDFKSPLDEERNSQMGVFMEIVRWLRPEWVLMENVVDYLKFCDGVLAKHAMARYLTMGYQAQLGICAAGCYGVPQFRARVFMWAALPHMGLPEFPMPTHDLVSERGAIPVAWQECVVGFDDQQCSSADVLPAITLRDVLEDLPAVTHEVDDSIIGLEYAKPAKTPFQQLMRRGMPEWAANRKFDGLVWEQVCLTLNKDDFERASMIPKKKGACFRDLPGCTTNPDGTANPGTKKLSSGKPIVQAFMCHYAKVSIDIQ